MILTREELACLDREIDSVEERLKCLRVKKAKSLILSIINSYYGNVELGRSILVDKEGKSYVLADLATHIDVNLGRHSYISLLLYAIKPNGKLAKKYKFVYNPRDYIVTGEKYEKYTKDF